MCGGGGARLAGCAGFGRRCDESHTLGLPNPNRAGLGSSQQDGGPGLLPTPTGLEAMEGRGKGKAAGYDGWAPYADSRGGRLGFYGPKEGSGQRGTGPSGLTHAQPERTWAG
ncbi:unnamed protein product [Linum trigynum]|uniref:Uncharacterized protein n=1 Tax=Linum trigynum TaxID=586398 RepID=A0AAV2GA68_9ROSI